eukprot:UN4838
MLLLFACYQILALGNHVLISSILLFSIYTYSNLLSVCTYNLITRSQTGIENWESRSGL